MNLDDVRFAYKFSRETVEQEHPHIEKIYMSAPFYNLARDAGYVSDVTGPERFGGLLVVIDLQWPGKGYRFEPEYGNGTI